MDTMFGDGLGGNYWAVQQDTVAKYDKTLSWMAMSVDTLYLLWSIIHFNTIGIMLFLIAWLSRFYQV